MNDFQYVIDNYGVGNFHSWDIWASFMNNYSINKALRIGAMVRARRGPRGGWFLAIASEEAWGRLMAWRTMRMLGVRGVRDEDLRG